ncbi:MAG TPA: hypothetical protein VEC38_09890 [Candidatus Binataceae bacterium]|nr:hypothetical protein [Candidatus Binataceae bacterium]
MSPQSNDRLRGILKWAAGLGLMAGIMALADVMADADLPKVFEEHPGLAAEVYGILIYLSVIVLFCGSVLRPMPGGPVILIAASIAAMCMGVSGLLGTFLSPAAQQRLSWLFATFDVVETGGCLVIVGVWFTKLRSMTPALRYLSLGIVVIFLVALALMLVPYFMTPDQFLKMWRPILG